MSVSYTACVLWGVQLNESDLKSVKPNPKWDGGKTKFDPQTGDRINETIVTKIYPGDLESKFKLDYKSTHRGEIVFGLKLSNSLDLEYDDSIDPLRIPTPAQLDTLRGKLNKLMAHLGLSASEPRPYLVCSVS